MQQPRVMPHVRVREQNARQLTIRRKLAQSMLLLAEVRGGVHQPTLPRLAVHQTEAGGEAALRGIPARAGAIAAIAAGLRHARVLGGAEQYGLNNGRDHTQSLSRKLPQRVPGGAQMPPDMTSTEIQAHCARAAAEHSFAFRKG